jgi:hypothetical protein
VSNKATKEADDELVPDTVVVKEFGITSMSLFRWEHDPTLGFPAKIKIRRRNYRSRRALEEFRQRVIGMAIKQQRQRLASRSK